VTVLKLLKRKSGLDIKDKRRTTIEFLLLKGCAGEKSLHATGMCTAQLRTVVLQYSVFEWINEACGGNEEPRNEGHPGRFYRHEIDAMIQSIRQDDPDASLRTIA
jgi:hypothetical protein